MAYVFYDFDTTGRDAYHDQIVQFAAVRANDDFQPVETFETASRLLDHIVPCPEHMRSIGIPAAQLENPTLPSHYTMVRDIQKQLSAWSPAVFLSNEAISFGEHAFRQALYKTLHSPYLTNTNNNCRTDVTRLLQAIFVHAPNVLAIPLTDKSCADFDLERVAAMNGFTSPLARSPMRAIHACIFLCKLIETRAPEVWSMFMQHSKKATVENFISAERIFALSDVYYGRAYRWLMTVIGKRPESSEFLVYNLAIDPKELAGFADNELESRISELPRPLRRLKSNGCPMLAYPDEFPFALPNGLDMAEIERRADFLHSNDALRDRLTAIFFQLHPKVEPLEYVEHQIYEGFFKRPDEARMAEFHSATSWMRRYELANEFEDDRLRTLALRLVHAEDPMVLLPARRTAYDRRVAERILGFEENAPWRNLRSALADLDKLLAVASEAEAKLLTEHRVRLQTRLRHAQSILV